MGNFGLFRLQDQRDNMFITQYQGAAVMMPDNPEDPNQYFQYDENPGQIINPFTGMCLDDLGGESKGGFDTTAVVVFSPCELSNTNQMFVMTTNNQIYNRFWPNNQICFNRDGLYYPGTSYFTLKLWACTTTNPDEVFNVLILCSPGTVLYIY